ncbi:MAG: type II secretion system protein [Kiritimatiellae bacterium]|nr:type II secretion system protein [Kiritimatiellia bacterium]
MNIRNKKGFTILELLVVISIIAIVATLATGAAIKALHQVRERRIDGMITILETAINTYRVDTGEWPFKISELSHNASDNTKYWAHGKNNKLVFSDLYEIKDGNKGYLDGSGLFAIYQGGRKRLNEVPKGSRRNLPLGYPDPKDQSIFRYFCVEYNSLTQNVQVRRNCGSCD